MAKPLKVTQAMKDELRKEFEEYLEKGKLVDGKVSFVRPYTYKNGNGKVRVHFTTAAYLKMTSLIDGFSGEVGWYGVVDRPEENLFVISDILVYPQTVGGTTVESDQLRDNSAYTKWMVEEVPDEIWSKARMQGHSHVNMPVFASGTDLEHQAEIVKQFNKDDQFYIFMIWNKKLEYTVKVYDMVTNTLFEDDDVEVTSEMAVDIAAFMKTAKEYVKVQTYNYGAAKTYGNGYNYSGGYNYGGYGNYGYDDDDDYDTTKNHAGGSSNNWQRKVYGDGKKESPAEKKDGSVGTGAGAGKIVDLKKPMA